MNPTKQHIHVVWCHPRTSSLTSTMVQEVLRELEQQDSTVDELDLYSSGFNGVLFPPDEPDWNNPNKHYTPEVHEAAARVLNADATIFVFPVWWYSVPALLKGYLDRVWNYGLLYGRETPHGLRAVRWIGLSGYSQAKLQKRHFDSMLEHHLNEGIAGFCGLKDSQVTLLCDTLGEEVHDFSVLVEQFKMTVRTVVRELVADLSLSSETTHAQVSRR